MYSVAAAFIVVKLVSDVFLFACWKLYPEPCSVPTDSEVSESSQPDAEQKDDDLSQYLVRVTDNQELIEITYRDRDRTNSASNRKRLSDFIRHGLESGKVFVAMAHETIV